MHTRRWLAAMTLATAFLSGQPAGAQDPAKPKPQSKRPARQIYELRTYVLNAHDDHALIDEYLANALIPALHRLGAGPVGVFIELPPTQNPKTQQAKTPRPPMMHVLVTYPKFSTWLSQERKLNKDKAYKEAAKPYLNAPKQRPAYVRIKTRVLRAFRGWPQIKHGID